MMCTLVNFDERLCHCKCTMQNTATTINKCKPVGTWVLQALETDASTLSMVVLISGHAWTLGSLLQAMDLLAPIGR